MREALKEAVGRSTWLRQRLEKWLHWRDWRASSRPTHERGKATFKRSVICQSAAVQGGNALAALQRTRRGRYSCGTTKSVVALQLVNESDAQ